MCNVGHGICNKTMHQNENETYDEFLLRIKNKEKLLKHINNLFEIYSKQYKNLNFKIMSAKEFENFLIDKNSTENFKIKRLAYGICYKDKNNKFTICIFKNMMNMILLALPRSNFIIDDVLCSYSTIVRHEIGHYLYNSTIDKYTLTKNKLLQNKIVKEFKEKDNAYKSNYDNWIHVSYYKMPLEYGANKKSNISFKEYSKCQKTCYELFQIFKKDFLK